MKKLSLMFIALSVMLTSCSWFDSESINPKIIGTGSIQYDTTRELWYVVIDSAQYTITRVTIPDNNPRTLGPTQGIEPVEGMLVTIFTSECMLGVQAVAGNQSVQQIEELYHTNDTGFVIILGLVFIVSIMALVSDFSKKTKKK